MVTIGADPEILLEDANANLVPIIGKVGGTKKNPLPIKELGEGYYIQEDNVALEFNIPAVTGSRNFAAAIGNSVQYATTVAGKLGLGLHRKSAGVFSYESLRAPEAMRFGCSSDNNAYEQGAYCAPVLPENLLVNDAGDQWRFCGGHIHVGYDAPHVPKFVAASFADLFIGLPLTAIDKQGERRKHYGQAGRYREKSYGIEYRTPSNAWLWNNNLTHAVASKAVALGVYLENSNEHSLRKAYLEVPWPDVRKAINEENPRLANSILRYAQGNLRIQGLSNVFASKKYPI